MAFVIEVMRACPAAAYLLQFLSLVIVRVCILDNFFELVLLILLFLLSELSCEALLEPNARALADFGNMIYGVCLSEEVCVRDQRLSGESSWFIC